MSLAHILLFERFNVLLFHTAYADITIRHVRAIMDCTHARVEDDDEETTTTETTTEQTSTEETSTEREKTRTYARIVFFF